MASSESISPAAGTLRLRVRLAWLLVAFSCLFFAFHGYQVQKRESALQGIDFKPLYGASRCFIAHCNPYDSQDAKTQFVAHGGDPFSPNSFRPHYLGYPPNALVLTLPLALLPYHAAYSIWESLLVLVFITAVFAIGNLCMPFSPLIGAAAIILFTESCFILPTLSQPTTFVIALCCIAVWCFLKNKFISLGIICFAVSLIFKPHLGALVLLYFLLANASYRKIAAKVIIVTVLLSLPGLIWASAMPESRHWMRNLSASLTAISAKGNLSDPSPANPEADQQVQLQAVIRYLHDDEKLASHLTWAICGVLLLAWTYPVLRMKDGLRKDYFCIAAIAPLALLPLYHRNYDNRFLLLTFPALALLLTSKKILASAALAVSLLITVFNYKGIRIIYEHGPVANLLRRIPAESPVAIFFARPLPLICLITALFYLACSYLAMRGVGKRKHSPLSAQ